VNNLSDAHSEPGSTFGGKMTFGSGGESVGGGWDGRNLLVTHADAAPPAAPPNPDAASGTTTSDTMPFSSSGAPAIVFCGGPATGLRSGSVMFVTPNSYCLRAIDPSYDCGHPSPHAATCLTAQLSMPSLAVCRMLADGPLVGRLWGATLNVPDLRAFCGVPRLAKTEFTARAGSLKPAKTGLQPPRIAARGRAHAPDRFRDPPTQGTPLNLGGWSPAWFDNATPGAHPAKHFRNGLVR
jgi:hypothetical protein